MGHREFHPSGLNIQSMLLGVAAGVVGTILFAAYREEKFNRVVRKTRDAGDRSQEYLSDLGTQMRYKADHAVEAAVNGVDKVGAKVRRAVGVATDTIEEKAHQAADRAHNALTDTKAL